MQQTPPTQPRAVSSRATTAAASGAVAPSAASSPLLAASASVSPSPPLRPRAPVRIRAPDTNHSQSANDASNPTPSPRFSPTGSTSSYGSSGGPSPLSPLASSSNNSHAVQVQLTQAVPSASSAASASASAVTHNNGAPPRRSPYHGPSQAPSAETTRLLIGEGSWARKRYADDDEDEDEDEDLEGGSTDPSRLPFLSLSYQNGTVGSTQSVPSSPGFGPTKPKQPSTASKSVTISCPSSPSASPPVASPSETDETNGSKVKQPTTSSPHSSRVYLAIILPISILLSVGNSISWKRMLNRFASVDGSQRNLEFFVNQFTLVLYALIAALICWYKFIFTNDITPNQRAYPQRSFAVMGFLDGVAGLLAAVGGSVTPGQVQIVIYQGSIPLTMLFSRLYLAMTKYTWSQYAGASVIVVGGAISALGGGGGGEDDDFEGSASASSSSGASRVAWYGSLLIFLSVIPGSMSNVYKEECFKEINLDVFYLSTWVSVWQTILSCLCVPLFTLQSFGGVPLHKMPRNFYEGWECFMGAYVDGFDCDLESPSTAYLLMTFVVVNFLYNLALLSMVKHGSALFLVIACAMALPLTNMIFTMEWVMGDDVEQFSVYNMVGLLLVVGGFLLYSLAPKVKEGEFVVPTGPAGQNLYVTEYLPSVILPTSAEYEAICAEDEAEGYRRRRSFDLSSSPSVNRLRKERLRKIERALESNSHTPNSKTP